MLFMHVIEDFHIQGFLAQAKQRTWWYNQPNFNSKYKYDYVPAILAHGFEWAFFIHIPIFYYIGISPVIFVSLFLNALFHAYVDHLKCNMYLLNLNQDQMLHVFQMALTILYLFVIYG